MRVLQLMAGSEHGGAEAFFTRLAIGLQQARVEQRVVVRPHAARVAALRAADIPTETLPFGGWLDFRTKSGLKHIIAKYQPNIVLSWMSRATKLCPAGDFVHVARLGGYYDLKYYRGCQHLIANTRGIAAYIRQEGWGQERVHYLPNFPIVAALPPMPRSQFLTPNDVPLALAMGRFHRSKGFDILLDAMVQAPKLFLWLAGDGPERAALQAQATRLKLLDRVRFLGWRDDGPALLASCDMLVSSSRSEPLGNTVVEAWAAGRPVIATAAAGPMELIKPNESGMLVPLEDAAALAGAMSTLADNPPLRGRLAEAGKARYAAEFEPSQVIAAYKTFFDKVAR